MDGKNVSTLKKCVNILTALLTLVLGVYLVVSCLGIYNGGEGEFTRTAVSNVLVKIAIPAYVWMFFVVLGGVLHFLLPSTKEKNKRYTMAKGTANDKVTFIVRICLAVIGAALVVIGIATGGVAGVLTKAVNICTECVGLG